MLLKCRYFFCACLIALSLGVSGCPNNRPEPARDSRPTRNAPSSPTAEPPAVPTFYSAPEQPVWQSVAGKTVILDAGHGGHDMGAQHFGLAEKDINLDLANRTAAALRAKGVVVHMTRRSDAFVPLPERSAFANRYPNSVLVSIHVNASERNPNATGVETFILTGDFSDAERSRVAAGKFRVAGSDPAEGKQALANLAARCRARGPVLANSIQKTLVGRLGVPDRGVKPGNLAVLRETYFCPAVLVEVGFLTNPRTALAMRTDEWRRRTSDALADGIVDFLRQPE